MNKTTLITLLLLLSLAVCCLGSDLYPDFTNDSWGDWEPGLQKKLASGTLLPAVASASHGDLFILDSGADKYLYQMKSGTWTIFSTISPVPDESLGTATASVASAAQPIIWDTGLNYLAMTASGVWSFEADVIGIGTHCVDVMKVRIEGAMVSNGTDSAILGSAAKSSHTLGSGYDWDIIATCTAPGRFRLLASTSANVTWTARLRAFEQNY